LVKDGAAAIRTLGSSVDTTTKALNPSTTLGDLEYRSATANTNTRLGIGSTGNVLTVTGGVPVWAAPAAPAAPSFAGCMLYKGANQAVSSNTITAVTFAATDIIDTDAFHDPSSNNSRITIPAGKAGKYLIYGVIYYGGAAVTTWAQSMIYKNGSAIGDRQIAARNSTGTNSGYTVPVQLTMDLGVGDYVELYAQYISSNAPSVYGTADTNGEAATIFGCTYLGA
jgi:hypothetical protein